MKIIKKIIVVAILLIGCYIQAQIVITNEANPKPTNNSVLLEFGNNEAKGIVLPTVDEAPNAVSGTFVVNSTEKAVQFFDGNDWVNLTEEGEVVANNYINAGENLGQGVVLGAETTTKPGVLVLESTTQALVLPKVSKPQENMASSIAATIDYDGESDTLAIYDGKNWSYWK